MNTTEQKLRQALEGLRHHGGCWCIGYMLSIPHSAECDAATAAVAIPATPIEYRVTWQKLKFQEWVPVKEYVPDAYSLEMLLAFLKVCGDTVRKVKVGFRAKPGKWIAMEDGDTA